MKKIKPNKIYCIGNICYLKMYRGIEDKWYTAKFDKEDLEKVKKYKWSVGVEGKNKKYYRPFNFSVKKLHQYLLGKKQGLVIDHINEDTLDNRKSNLRHVTHQQNTWNRTHGHNVYYAKDRNKWRANVVENGKVRVLGSFKTKKEALEARLKWEKIFYK